ncbi:hypothetical protein V2E29_03695 [Streptomyces diastatochromogenes]|uniref:hypothetical protein n=1 Tax=Streptomyces diastatochromogenes TaxID=42236 RepID=UPI002F26CA89
MAETMKKAPPVSRGLGDLVAFLSLDVTAGSVRQGAGAGRNIYVAGPTHREPTDAAVGCLTGERRHSGVRGADLEPLLLPVIADNREQLSDLLL